MLTGHCRPLQFKRFLKPKIAFYPGFPALLYAAASAVIVAGLAGCATGGGTQAVVQDKAREGLVPVDQLQIVDCLLPGKIRKLGNTTYQTQRRPIRTTSADCEIRGGEYVAYDRADYRSALKVWLAEAESGDAKAQNYVGEIFEKGLGREPDYVSAAQWYKKAAAQGDTRAQINLGFLYEKGLGVKQDVATALNWYRKASGASSGSGDIVWESTVEEVRSKLEAQLESARQQVSVLESQLQRTEQDREKLQRQVESARKQGGEQAAQRYQSKLADANRQVETLKQLYSRAQGEQQTLGGNLQELPKVRSPQPVAEQAPAASPAQQPLVLRDINFGRYYALIIGNQKYLFLQNLDTPTRDALELKQVLESRYGFSTLVVQNGNEEQILNALNDLYKRLEPQDNLLIYYAGHGNLNNNQSAGERVRGYWLPVEAQPDNLTHWINNSVISDHLDRLKARSVLVLADSCYAGSMASQESALLLGSAAGKLSQASIKQGISRRSRMVISSGGIQPVLDSAGGQHSLFAGALLDALQSNDQILRENQLFARVAVNVRRRAAKINVQQTPEMRPIRAAGHEGGDFYFVPKGALATRESEQRLSMLRPY